MLECKNIMSAPIKFASTVTDPKLVEERRTQILGAAIKLFSDKGYYRTTILDIAKTAGISSGLIYQYFSEKEDVLCFALLHVVDTYEREIPPRIAGAKDPVDRLCQSVEAYCTIVDDLRDATLLAYRSTKSLSPAGRKHVMAGEQRSNQIILGCINECIDGGYFREVNSDLLVYQFVMYCHTWALKYWAFRNKYTLKQYVDEGLKLLVEPYLTPRKGRGAFRKRQETAVVD